MNARNEHEIDMDLNDNSVAHSETFGDLREILEYLLRKDFISPEDAEEAAAKFKTTYLTLQNKVRFLPFMEEFVAEAESSDEFALDRVESLRDELETFYDRMVSNFSIHRVAGYDDPDQNNKDKLSDDIDESFDFASTHKLNQNLFGPEIPEKLRPVITKVLEQISTYHDQKLANRIQLISKWRYLRLAHQVEKFKRQAPALNTLQKYLLRKYGIFYKLRSFAQFQSTYSAYTSHEVVQKYKDEISSLRQQLSVSLNGHINYQNGKKPNHDYEKEIKLRDERIEELENELKTSLSTQASQNVFGANDEVIKLKNTIKDLEVKIDSMKDQILDKDKLLSMQNSAAKSPSPVRRRVRVVDDTTLDPAPKPFTIGLVGDLTKNGKLRYFVKILQKLQFKLKASGYASMIKQYVAHKRALLNVTDRIKGRLLIQTRLLNCGQDIRRSFLKWLIKSNPDLLRESITKIGVTAKLSHQVAIWRLKKLVFKPLHHKLPQAVRNIRTLKGFFILQNLFDLKSFINTKNAIHTLNPNHKNKKGLKIESAINRILTGSGSGKLLLALRALRHHRTVQSKALNRIFNNNIRNQEIAFMCMKLKGRHNNDVNVVRSTYALYDRLSSNYVGNLHKTLAKLRVDKSQLSKLMLSRLLDNHRSKQTSALKALKLHKELSNADIKIRAAESTTQNIKVSGILAKIDAISAVKAQSVITALKSYSIGNKYKQLTKDEKLKKLFTYMQKSMRVKNQIALNTLKLWCFSDRFKWKFLRKALIHFYIKAKNSKRIALNILKNNRLELNNLNAIDNKKVSHLMHRIVQTTKSKCGTTLNNLLAFKRRKMFDDVRVKDQLNYRLQRSADTTLRQTLKALVRNKEAYARAADHRKNQHTVLSLLCQNLKGKAATCLFNMVYLKKDSDINKGKHDAVKTNLFNTLMKRTGIKANAALADLVSNKNAVLKKNMDRKNKLNRAKSMLDNALFNKMRKALLSLKNNANNVNHHKSKSDILKKTVIGTLLNNIKMKQRKIVSVLLKNNMDRKSNETNKNARQIALIRAFKRNIDDLRSNVLSKLMLQTKSITLADTRRALFIKRALAKLFDNLNKKKERSINMLRKNQKDMSRLEKLKLRLVNGLKSVTEKPRSCLFKIRLHAKSAKMGHMLRNQKAKNLINQLLQSNKSKLRTVVSTLLYNNIIEADRQQRSEIENAYKSRLERRKRNGLLHLLVASIAGKAAKCLFSLIKFNETAMVKEREMMNNLRFRIEQLVASKQKRTRQALNALRKHKLETEETERQLFGEKEKIKHLLGKSSDPYETSKFNNFMRYIKAKQSANYSNPRFEKLIAYMRENNGDDNYTEVLQLIDNGNITNLEELYEYITINNNRNQYKSIMDLYNAKDLEINDIKNYMVLNNRTGKYTRIIQQMEDNNFNKVDLVNYIEKNNFNGELDDLNAFVNGTNKLDDVMNFMKANNKSGLYKEPLQHLNNLTNPKLEDLMTYIKQNNRTGKYNDLAEFIENQGSKRKIQDLENYMRSNNADGRYDKVLNHIRRNSNLSDLYNYLSFNKNDPVAKDLLSKLDESEPKKDLLRQIEMVNYNGKYDDLIEMAKDPSIKVSDILTFINRNNTDNKYNDVLTIVDNPHSIAHYVNYMKENNQDGRFDDVLRDIKKVKDPKLESVISIIQRCNKDNKLDDIVELINRNENSDELIDFIKRKNVDGKFDALLAHIKNNPDIVVSSISTFIQSNNSNGAYNEVLNKMNRTDGKNKVSQVIQFIKHQNASGKYDNVIHELSNFKDPKITDLMRIIEVHNKNDNMTELFNIIDQQPNELKVSDVMQYMVNNNKNGQYNELINHLNSIENAKVSDVASFINKDNKDGKYNNLLQIINQEHIDDPINNAMKHLRSNNNDGRFDNVLRELEQRPDLKLTDLLDILRKHNKGGELNNLVKKLNDDKPKPSEDVLSYVNNRNIGGKFNGLIEFLKRKPNARLTDILNYINNNNSDGRYNELLDVINGEILKPSRLLDYLNSKNKDGIYDELIAFINSDPNIKMTDIMNFIRSHNADGRYNSVLSYINNNGVDEYSDEADVYFKFLSNARRRGEYPELFSYLEQNNMQDPEEILKYLKLNNKDGRYDDLILRTQDYLKLFNKSSKPTSTGRRFDLTAALRAKQRACIVILREHCKEQRWLVQHNTSLRRKLLNAISSTRNLRLAKIFEKLVNHKRMAVNHETKVKNAQSRLSGLLLRSQNDKIATSLNQLRTNNNYLNRKLKKRHVASQIIASKLNSGFNAKTFEALVKLKLNNVTVKAKHKIVVVNMFSNLFAKKKTVIHKLMKHNIIMKQEKDKSKAILFNLLNLATQNKALCLSRLIKHAKDTKDAEMYRLNVLTPTFNRLCLANNIKLKSAVDSLGFNSEDSKRYHELTDQKLKNVISRLPIDLSKCLNSCVSILRKNNTEAKSSKQAQKRTLTKLMNVNLKKLNQVVSSLRNHNSDAKAYYDNNKQKMIGTIIRLRNNNKSLLNQIFEILKNNKVKIESEKNQRVERAKNTLLGLKNNQSSKLKRTLNYLRERVKQYNKAKSTQERILTSLLNANGSKLRKVFANLNNNKNFAIANEQIKKQRLNRLFSRLDNANVRKLRTGISAIKANNDDINRDKQRRAVIAGTIARRLLDPYTKVQLKTINALRAHNSGLKTKEDETKTALRSMTSIFNRNKNSNLQKHLSALRSSAADTKNDHDRKRRLFANINLIHKRHRELALAKVLGFLKHNNIEQRERTGHLLRAVSILRPIKRKLEDQTKEKYLRALIDGGKEIKLKNEQLTRNTRHMCNKLINANEIKANQSLRLLTSEVRSAKTEDDRKKQALKNLINRAASCILGLKLNALQELTNNKNDSLNKKRLSRYVYNNLFNKFNKTALENKQKAINILKSNNDAINKYENVRKEIVRKICYNSLLNKCRLAFSRLRDHNGEIKGKLGRLLSTLPTKQLLKVNSSLSLLKENSANARRLQEDKRNKVMAVGRRIKENQLSQLREALKIFVDNNNLVKDKIRYLASNLQDRQKSIKTEVLSVLRNYAKQNREEEEQKTAARRLLIARLESNQSLKARSSISDLKVYSAVAQAKKQMNDDKMRSILLKLAKAKLQHCLSKLVINNMEEAIRQNKMRALITKTLSNKRSLQRETINLLKENRDKHNKKLIQQSAATKHLVQNINIKTIGGALRQLQSHKDERTFKISQCLQLIKNKTQRVLSEHMNSLKLNRFLLKRNELNSYLTSLILSIRKNHRSNLRTAMDHWSNKKLKDSTRRMKDVLERLIGMRNSQTYHAIKRDFLMKKFNKQIKGLLNLIRWTEEKEAQRVSHSFKHLVQMFVDKNPWFSKVIKILAVKSKPNYQISFWRLRHAKNIRNEHLSASDAIKFKKMVFILNKEFNKNLSFSFMRIQNVADQASGRYTQYFGTSLIPKYK